MKITCFIAVIFFATTDHISASVNRLQPRTTIACVPPYKGKGYGRSYNYKCVLTTGTYPNNTPCLPVNNGGNRIDEAGLCQKNRCKPYYNLDKLLERCVFPPSLNKCPPKENTAKIVLESCRYYCKKDGEWYFGNYKNLESSSCHLPGETNRLGKCCDGKCVKQGECKEN
uniref:Putative secreted protein n=1 Tax=Amblyomma triste TaxID=251400 RepID=A0A023G8W1_AMBTT